jgi:hypothetical protein
MVRVSLCSTATGYVNMGLINAICNSLLITDFGLLQSNSDYVSRQEIIFCCL